MKVAGIIAEYNPFHNGHKFHMEEVKRITGADYLVVVMSGNFTQRGTPAIIDKYARAKMALSSGADLVIEIPTCYATGSAEYFSAGAIALLDKIGVVDSICFGSECGDILKLEEIAKILADEPALYQKILKQELRSGKTFPIARKSALEQTIKDFATYSDVIQSPNNILGIEYIKNIIRQDSSLNYYTNKRIGSGYHDHRFSPVGFSSAISIRQALASSLDLSKIKDQLPAPSLEILEQNFEKKFPIFANDFSSLLKYKLLLESGRGYERFLDVTSDLSDRITNQFNEIRDFEQFCEHIKTKDITYARTSRCLGHILLDIKKSKVQKYMDAGIVFYARVLGFKDSSNILLKQIKEKGSIPLITQCAQAKELLSPIGLDQFEKDIQASHIYESLIHDKFDTLFQNEYQRQIQKM